MLHSQVLKSIEQRLLRYNLPVGLELWNGKVFNPAVTPKVTIKVRKPNGLMSLMRPNLGRLARSYVEQEIDLSGCTRDIIGVGESLCDAQQAIDKHGGRILGSWWHSRVADRKHISHHYDVSNEFYQLWLDSRRVYSCAYFRQPDDSLDLAQEQKLEHICRKLDLKPDETFLDIGCGWGGLMLWAAEHYHVRAVGITLSQSQHDYVQEQISQRGLQDRCEVRLMDYRDVPESEQYDKIASVGMFEHVGNKNLPLYFGKIYRMLKPGGLVMNHGITAAATNRAGLGSGIAEFINDYVFPGGELAHVSSVLEVMSQQKLECHDAECLRPHYAKTLWHWVERLEASEREAKRLVGEDKYRTWQIYMAGSAHAFDRGWLSIFQILGSKPLPNGVVPYPLTREHVYRA